MTLVERACAVTVLVASCFAWPLSTARAQSAGAEALFRDGRTLIQNGKIAAGCDKFAASERLESSVGTLLNLGDCREKLGKLASAWAAFRKAEAMAKRAGGDDKRQAEAKRRALRLEPRLAYLEIDVSPRVDGLIVHRDDEIVDVAQWNTALPLDPGSYTIVAEAPGYQVWRARVSIHRDAERQTVVVPRLERIPGSAVNESVAARPAELRPAPAEHAEVTEHAELTTHRTWSTTRTLSVGLAVAGAGALGTAIYFGFHAADLQERSDRRCPLTVCTDPEGLRLNDQAKASAMRANILYIAGGGTLATAVVLWFVGRPNGPSMIPTTGDHQIGVAMTGRF